MSETWANGLDLHVDVSGIAAGLHVVVDLPTVADEHRAVARAGLVIGYARPPEHAYTTAIARLCAVLADR